MYQYQLKSVSQVIAGDHVVVLLDLGFKLTTQVELMLSNCETPRFGEPGKQARIFTEKWLDPSSGPFTVQVSKDRHDKYEAQIFNGSGADLGDDLVEAKIGRQAG